MVPKEGNGGPTVSFVSFSFNFGLIWRSFSGCFPSNFGFPGFHGPIFFFAWRCYWGHGKLCPAERTRSMSEAKAVGDHSTGVTAFSLERAAMVRAGI